MSPYGGTTSAQDKQIERCVARVMATGKAKSNAIAICKSSIMKGENVNDLIKKLNEQGLKCSCIKCGYAVTAKEGQHCNSMKCPKCGGQMRRASRLGPGQEGGETKMAKKKKVQNESFTEELVFSFGEGSINEEKRLVRVCALAPCISKNNRYYSPAVIESASGTLSGKRSFADHDKRDTDHLIGRIVGEKYENGKLYADIKVSKAKGLAGQIWEKIKDGTVDAVSIAADGATRRIKMGDKKVDEVISLDIKSVDFVPEGGVAAARVMQVFENIKDIPNISEVKEEMIETLEQLKEKYPDFVTELEEATKQTLQDEIEKLRKEKEAAEFKLIEKELAEYKEAQIKKLETSDKVRDILRNRVSGKTKEDISASLEKEFEYIKMVTDATKVEAEEAKIEGVPENKKTEKKPDKLTSEAIRSNSNIPDIQKGIAIELLWNEGEEKARTFLKKWIS